MKRTKQLKQLVANDATSRRTPQSRRFARASLPPGLKTISVREFAGRFANGVRVSQQHFTWFLGAGCSISSGIMDAAGLADKWLREQHELQARAGTEFEAWVRAEFSSYDANNLSALYAAAFARRHPSPVERQREIEMICSRGEPAYGYATLAQILSHLEYGRLCNTVLTTNFDDLIADALYLYGERHARPLVVTHEALARYVRTNSPRPTVVKLHGDAHLDPKNLQPETREIDLGLAQQLYPFLQDHALIFAGYGGNDESILKFVQNSPVPALAPPIFWISKKEPPMPFAAWLHQRNALRVEHTDFDQLMHLIRNSLNIELLDRTRWNHIGDAYYESFERLKDEIEKLTVSSEDTQALKVATSATEKTLPNDWSYFTRAREHQASDPDEAERIYKEGLTQFPASRVLHANYAVFLKNIRSDGDSAEPHYKLALQADPNHAVTLGNYAIFLETVRKDMDAAERYYKRSLEIDPKRSTCLTNYANFLKEIRRDMDGAESYFKRAVEANPNEAGALGSYAVFLETVRKEIDSAEDYYKRAIEAEPTRAVTLRNYADFLEKNRNDLDAAETFYKRAIEADPNDADSFTRYADFLMLARKDIDAAEAAFKRAIEVNPKNARSLSGYAAFLETRRKDMDAAEQYYKRAVEADPARAVTLRNYADFLEKTRKDMDAAEILYKRAIEADPRGAENFRRYGDFLKDVRNNMNAAGASYKSAIEVDPHYERAISSYASFLEREKPGPSGPVESG